MARSAKKPTTKDVASGLDVVVAHAALRSAVERAVRVTSPKSPFDLGKSFRLEVVDREIRVDATDSYQAMSIRVPTVSVAATGSCIVNAAELTDRVARRLGEDDVHLTVVGERLVVKSPTLRRRFELPQASAENFPMHDPPQTRGVVIPGSRLAEVLTRSLFAATDDQTKPNQHAAAVRVAQDVMRVACTDGHRLAIASVPCQGEMLAMIPKDFARLIAKLATEYATEHDDAGSGSGDITLTIDDRRSALWVTPAGGDFTYQAKLVDADPVPLDGILQTIQEVTVVDVNRADLVSAIRAAQSSHDAAQGSVLTVAAGGIHIAAESSEKGAAEIDVDAEVKGPDVVMSISDDYVAEHLSALGDERVTLAFNGQLDPLVIRGEGSFGLVMPLRPK